MEIISTHINADFDAVGSMLAARKLYPDARMVFPGGQEKSLRDFFVRSTLLELPLVRAKEIDPSAVTRVILVDCRQRSRIGRIAEFVDREGVEVVIFDHHPDDPDDVTGDVEHVETAGSTLAILCALLEERGIALDAHEATIMQMGVYEDTGSLTFTSTTAADYRAASYLLGQGADLSLVAELMNRMMTSEQILILSDLVRSLTRHAAQGVEFYTTTAGVGEYVDELAFLVHRLVDMENVPAVFALFVADDRITLIARSRTDEIDAGKVSRVFGGGGHANAASATFKNLTPAHAMETLLEAVHASVVPSRTARQMMTYPVRTVNAGDTIADARAVLTRFDINTVPVVGGGRLRGLLSRQVVDKATHHGLEADRVDGYMSTQFKTISPDAPFTDVYAIMISGQQPMVPVAEDGLPVGVITRVDFLRHLRTGEPTEPGSEKPLPGQMAATRPELRKDVNRLIKSRLPPRTLERLLDLGKTAARLGYSAYLVGGIVRDLLLDNPNTDVDVVVEGDGVRLATEYAASAGARATVHERFATAVIVFDDGVKFDVATARTEYYDRPAALPVVEASSLKLDLYRRDFSINTLVLGLNPTEFGRLIDFFGAYRDLKEGVIRVLHSLSFIEDPTRILRAVRFEQRFNFPIGRPTRRVLDKAIELEVLERLSGPRLFSELRLILSEEDPRPALERLHALKLFPQIHPALKWLKRNRQVADAVDDAISWWTLAGLSYPIQFWRVRLYGLLAYFNPADVSGFCERMGVTGRARARVLADKAAAEHVVGRMARRSRFANSFVFRLCEPLSNEALLLAMAKTYRAATRRAISTYLTRLKGTKPKLSGRDLKAMDIEPGPIYKQILDRVLDAKLDGKAPTKQAEIELAKALR